MGSSYGEPRVRSSVDKELGLQSIIQQKFIKHLLCASSRGPTNEDNLIPTLQKLHLREETQQMITITSKRDNLLKIILDLPLSIAK